ncbi:MAG TPA: hypothetical protein VFY35_03430 [Burkholderiaceae bacterium]|nr:hypothetical protein [Burkholderiaceae bacterium]
MTSLTAIPSSSAHPSARGMAPHAAPAEGAGRAPNEPARQTPPAGDPALASRGAASADGGLPPRAALGELRQRRPSAPAGEGVGPLPPQPDAPPDFMGRMGAGARVAGGHAFNALIALSKLWVGAMAVSAGYRALRNPTDYLFHPVATTIGAATFGARTTQHNLDQGRALVQAAYGDHIPANAACNQVTPEISWNLADIAGNYGLLKNNRWMESEQMRVAAYTSLADPQHVVNHEFIHCHTHPNFLRAIEKSPDAVKIDEGITEHLADQLPGHWATKLGVYDLSRLPDGKTWTQAAAELEKAVGREVLHAAVFSGAPDAVYQVSQAMLQIWSKVPDPDVWMSAMSAPSKARQPLAEAVIGASLLYQDRLPEPMLGYPPRPVLPIARVDDIGPADAARLREQAQQARERIGPRFDLAFCQAGKTQQRRALMDIQDDLARHWKPVLTGKA